MDLKQFIHDVLVNVVEAIDDAGKAVADRGAMINPNGQRARDRHQRFTLQDIHLNQIEFDISVTVADKAGVDGKAGIRVMGLEVGGGGKQETSSSSVSRIKFSVPMLLPSTAERADPATPTKPAEEVPQVNPQGWMAR